MCECFVAVMTEQFVGYLVKHAIQYTNKDKRKTIKYKDLANVVNEVEQFQFLQDIIPMSKTKAELKAAVALKNENDDNL